MAAQAQPAHLANNQPQLAQPAQLADLDVFNFMIHTFPHAIDKILALGNTARASVYRVKHQVYAVKNTQHIVDIIKYLDRIPAAPRRVVVQRMLFPPNSAIAYEVPAAVRDLQTGQFPAQVVYLTLNDLEQQWTETARRISAENSSQFRSYDFAFNHIQQMLVIRREPGNVCVEFHAFDE